MQYNLPFYLQYLASWPEYCLTAEGPGKEVMAYILGKSEGEGEKWHGHVTAVTVAPEYRYMLLAFCKAVYRNKVVYGTRSLQAPALGPEADE